MITAGEPAGVEKGGDLHPPLKNRPLVISQFVCLYVSDLQVYRTGREGAGGDFAARGGDLHLLHPLEPGPATRPAPPPVASPAPLTHPREMTP